MNPILINDIKPEVFRHLIRYLYGRGLVVDECITFAKDLIDAADKYGVINLRLEAEVWYVHSATISAENVIDNLLYADAKNCALLKEALMDFIVENKKKSCRKYRSKMSPETCTKIFWQRCLDIMEMTTIMMKERRNKMTRILIPCE